MQLAAGAVVRRSIELVEAYLRLMAERRLGEAARHLAPDARLIFPAGRVFQSLEALVADAAGRYRQVDKRRDRWDVCERPDGSVVVYSLGTLVGVNLHGVPFEGVRYIDRFELCDGTITLQEVWNDLAASGVLERPPGGEPPRAR